MTALTHDQARQFLEMDREQLSAVERAALDRHLADCAPCRSVAAELAALQTAVEHVLRKQWDDVRPDPQLENRMQTWIRTQTMPKRILNNALGLAGLVVFTIVVIAFFSMQTQLTAIKSPVATPPVTPGKSPTSLSGQDFYQLQRLTTMSRDTTWNDSSGASHPAVSPHGRRVAYSGKRVGDDHSDIYVLDLASRVETRLTNDPANNHILPTWSPDGTRLAYERFPAGASSLDAVEHVVMNADGSNPQVIYREAYWAGYGNPAWSPSGDRIVLADDLNLVVVSINERREIRRFRSVEDQYISQPIWYDENQILFVDQGIMKLGNVATGKVKLVSGPTGPVAQVMVLGTDIAYIRKEDSSARVIRQDLAGTYSTTMGIIQIGELSVGGTSWSPDGRFVAVQTVSDLYVAAEHVPASWHHAPMFNLGTDLIFPMPVRMSWLPDGSGFVVEQAFNSERDLYLVQLNLGTIKLVEDNAPVAQVPPRVTLPTLTPTPTQVGEPFPTMTPGPTVSPTPTQVGEPFPTLAPFPTVPPTPERIVPITYQLESLTSSSFSGYRPVVSPDGQRVIYADERDGSAGIFALDLKTRAETRLTVDVFRDLEASWSPDGSRIAYEHVLPLANGSAASIERIVINADGSNKQVISSGTPWLAGSEAPAWSPDGTRLAFTDGTELVVVNVADRRELKRFGPVDPLIPSQPAWFDDQHVLFVSERAAKVANVATGAVETMSDSASVIQALVIPHGIAYIEQDGSTVRARHFSWDGHDYRTTTTILSVFQAEVVGRAVASPDERFVAIETTQGLYLAAGHGLVSRRREPLFNLSANLPPFYLRGVSWLPDGSGFVSVAAPDGQPALYLIRFVEESDLNGGN